MPAIKLSGQVSDLQVVPEAYRDKYEKAGDGFVLKEIEIEDVAGLRNTVTATRQERDALAEKYKGVNLDEWNEYSTNKDKLAADAAKAKGDWDANVARINQQNKTQLDAKDAEIAKRQRALESEMIDSRARAALATAGGNQLFLLPHVTPSLKIVEENGTFIARVVDASGAVRVNSAGNPMSIDERVAELKSDTQFAGAFAASGSGGTGSPVNAGGGKSNGGNKQIKRDAFDQLPPAQRDARIKEGFAVVD
jgi:hypothetical protein